MLIRNSRDMRMKTGNKKEMGTKRKSAINSFPRVNWLARATRGKMDKESYLI